MEIRITSETVIICINRKYHVGRTHTRVVLMTDNIRWRRHNYTRIVSMQGKVTQLLSYYQTLEDEVVDN